MLRLNAALLVLKGLTSKGSSSTPQSWGSWLLGVIGVASDQLMPCADALRVPTPWGQRVVRISTAISG